MQRDSGLGEPSNSSKGFFMLSGRAIAFRNRSGQLLSVVRFSRYTMEVLVEAELIYRGGRAAVSLESYLQSQTFGECLPEVIFMARSYL